MKRSKETTTPGFENKNGQVVTKRTSKAGTDYNQYIYILRCKYCKTVYGVNGSDIWERRCPRPKSICPAGGGRPGVDS